MVWQKLCNFVCVIRIIMDVGVCSNYNKPSPNYWQHITAIPSFNQSTQNLSHNHRAVFIKHHRKRKKFLMVPFIYSMMLPNPALSILP